MEGTVETIFCRELCNIKKILPKVRPLAFIDAAEEIINDRKQLRKLYKRWLLMHHPDKNNSEEDEISLFIIKEYGNAFLNYEDEEYDNYWRYMHLSEEVFKRFDDIDKFSVAEIESVSDRVCQMLNLIHNSEDNFLSEVSDMLINVIHFLDLAVTRSNLYASGVCCLHSTVSDHIFKHLCEKCNSPVSSSVSSAIVIYSSGEEETFADSTKLNGSTPPKRTPKRHHPNAKSHKKKENPTRRKSNMFIWSNCEFQKVPFLPNDIDGNSKYELSFDKDNRMKSTLDGRNWKTWVTSLRSDFNGIRRKAYCSGSYICNNEHCSFMKQYQSKNQFHFQKNKDCKICGAPGDKLECGCVKIWEFVDEEFIVYVFHGGYHTCKPKSKTSENEQFKDTFERNKGKSVNQVASEAIIDALKNPDLNYEELRKLADNFSDVRRLKNFKTRLNNNDSSNGFEAVATLRKRVIELDPFFIYRINDRDMNGSPSFVFKMSRTQADIALSMDCKREGVRNIEYCYIDGTFKRCSNFITLGAHVYDPNLRKILKLATMEVESEGSENWQLFWNLLNNVLADQCGNTSYMFNPVGWVLDEGGGMWDGLKKVFGNDAIEKSVSCEIHYTWSVEKYTKMCSSRTSDIFKTNALGLMRAETPQLYMEKYYNINLISEKPSKRKFMWHFLKFWHLRRSHFSKAFKNTDAPKTNLSECFHSSYTTTKQINFSLLDAAHYDIVYAIRLEASIKAFGSGIYCQGYGPNEKQRADATFANRQRRANAFANEIFNEACNNPGPSGFVNPNSKHRPSNVSVNESSSEDDMPSKKSKKEERKERSRSIDTKHFKESLSSIEKVRFYVTNHYISFNDASFSIRSNYAQLTVGIKLNKPFCTWFTKRKKSENVCKHIIWMLINIFQLGKYSNILPQVYYTDSEVAYLFSKSIQVDGQTNGNSESTSQKSSFTPAEIEGIFESHKEAKAPQKWFLGKVASNMKACCCTCRSTMPKDKLFIFVAGLYIPKDQQFAVSRTFYFCAFRKCVSKKPYMSNLLVPPQSITYENILSVNDEDMRVLVERSLPIQ